MTLDMNPEIRAQWCAALRSGEYQQAKHALRVLGGDEPGGYCCLGVLTDLYLKAGHSEIIDNYESDDPAALPVSVWDLGGGVLPGVVADWAGLGLLDPVLKFQPLTKASGVNDSGATFAQIADLIDGGAS